MVDNSSVIAGWVVAAGRALEALGIDSDGVLLQAGIDLSLGHDCDARYFSHQTRRFWQLAEQAADREDIGLHVAKFIGPTTFHALGFSIWASATLLDALERMVKFDSLLNDGCSLDLQLNQQQQVIFTVLVHQRDDIALVAVQGVDYFLASVIKILNEIQGTIIKPISLSLQRTAPKNSEPWLTIFNCPVSFEAEQNQLVFNLAQVNKLLPTANLSLAMENDKLVVQYLKQRQANDTVTMLEAKLTELMARSIVAIDEVAEEMGLTARSLQYQLNQQQTSYTQVLNTVRARMAKQYLHSSNKNINEIAYLLGFSEPSHFNRAFKRWTQQTPSDFRERNRS